MFASCGGRGVDGARAEAFGVIYYFHSEALPLYLLTVFGKGEKADLSQAERNELAKLVQVLKGLARETR